jgi:aspartate ammonia-lyase
MNKIKCIGLLLLVMLIGFQSAQAQKKVSTTIAPTTRTEKDLLGEKQIPFDAYYGVQTARALENFSGEWNENKFLSRLCESVCYC